MKTFAIGDIHGMLNLLEKALSVVAEHDGPKTVVFTGDYCDRGPDSRGVIQRLMDGPQEADQKWVVLKGNHDDMMAKAILTDDKYWVYSYGAVTLQKYITDGAYDNDALRTHALFLKGLPTLWEDDERIFVHAGLDPSIASLHHQSDSTRLWIREEFLNCDHDFGKLVVHGHTPYLLNERGHEIERTANRVNIDTGACFGGHLTMLMWEGPGRDWKEAWHF